MIKCLLLSAILCTIFVFAHGQKLETKHTLKYSASEFEKKLATHKLAVVDYYAPWCHYSKALLPEFDHSAYVVNTILKMDVAMITIDCYNEAQKALCPKNGILGYPTVKVYKNGVFFKNFEDDRTSDKIVYFVVDIIHGLIR